MTATVIAALAVSSAMAAGGVVDVVGAAEARATEQATEVGAALQGGLVLRPQIQGAYALNMGALRAGYAPQFSFVSTGYPNAQFTMLHAVDVGGDLRFSRLRFNANVGGSLGTLDAATLQTISQGSSTAIGVSGGTIPYASASLGLGGDARLARGLDLTVRAGSTFSSSPGTDDVTVGSGIRRIPTVVASGGTADLNAMVARNHTLVFGLDVRNGFLIDQNPESTSDNDAFLGVAPIVGYRLASPSLSLDLRGGAGPYYVVLDTSPAIIVLPIVEARLGSQVDLPGAAALDGAITATLAPVTDPMGALLEERAGLGVTGAVRVRRDIVIGGGAAAFAPIEPLRVGGLAKDVDSGPTLAINSGLTWAFMERASTNIGLVFTGRSIKEQTSFDVTVSLGINGLATIFHEGARPRGTDPRPGRQLGETRIGAPPPPNVIEAPTRLEDALDADGDGVDDAEPPQVFTRPLAAPPPNIPPEALKGASSPADVLLPGGGGTGTLKREDLKKKKKKSDQGGGENADETGGDPARRDATKDDRSDDDDDDDKKKSDKKQD